jgi:cystathionine gamma-lyase
VSAPDKRQAGFATRAIHAGQDPEPRTGAVVVPIFQTSTYAQEDIGAHKGFEYSRTDNPTRSALQETLAALDDAEGALCFSSGMAAEATLMALLSSGDHVVASDDLYGGTYRLFEQVFRKYGLDFTFVDGSDTDAVEAAMRPETKLVWMESPTNPLLKIVDLTRVAAIAHGSDALLVVDNTFASPYLQQCIRLGTDIVVYSATKYLGGHSDVVMGTVAFRDAGIRDQVKFHQNAIGAVPGPLDCFLLQRGLKTLALRMEKHCSNAMAVAQLVESRRDVVRRVVYPGLASHPHHELAARQMSGFGGIVSIELDGLEAASSFMRSLELFALAESLGGVESLADHPAVMTHASVPQELREAAGISMGLVRLSVGIEDPEDLLRDVESALAAC